MRRYEPIKPIDAEAAARSMKDADRLRERWDDLRAAAGEDRVRAAVDGERWRAAVETGVIERLYQVSPGVTEAIVRSGLEADEALQLDAEVYDQIAAHHHAETVVVDAVRHAREPTTSLIRELHAAVTHAQSHYTAYDQFGRAFRRPLAHGEYKDQDNHVRLPDGTLHEYAPAIQVASEMDQLIDMVVAVADDHPVRVAAFAHHRFAKIHPFADGNGRAGRLLASFVLVKGGFLPLVVAREERDTYLLALQRSDAGDLVALIDFFVRMQRDTLLRVEQVTLSSTAASGIAGMAEVLARHASRRLGTSAEHRDLERQVVDPVLERVARLLNDTLEKALAPFRSQRFDADRPIYPMETPEDPGPFKQLVEDAGFLPADKPRIGRQEIGFRIGTLDSRHAVVGVIALATVGDGDAAVALDDQAGRFRRIQAPVLTVSVEGFNERDVRRWVEDWLGQMLVDYTQRL